MAETTEKVLNGAGLEEVAKYLSGEKSYGIVGNRSAGNGLWYKMASLHIDQDDFTSGHLNQNHVLLCAVTDVHTALNVGILQVVNRHPLTDDTSGAPINTLRWIVGVDPIAVANAGKWKMRVKALDTTLDVELYNSPSVAWLTSILVKLIDMDDADRCFDTWELYQPEPYSDYLEELPDDEDWEWIDTEMASINNPITTTTGEFSEDVTVGGVSLTSKLEELESRIAALEG